MSDATDPRKGIFDLNVCSQCLQSFPRSTMREARHAVPCGHIFCKGCLVIVEAEQKSGKSACRRQGCKSELAPVSEFAISWTASRAERIKAEHSAMFSDQGDVGDHAPGGSDVQAEQAWKLCAEHKLPFQVVERATSRPLCAECMVATMGNAPTQSFGDASAALEASSAATSAELARLKSKLAEPTFMPEEYCDGVTRWGAQETARIRAWEEREIKQVHLLANGCVAKVQEICARRIEVGASLFTQRAGLRVSLEELDRAMSDLPKDPAARLIKKQTVFADQLRLRELLSKRMISVPSARAVREWAELPVLSSLSEEKAVGMEAVVENAVLTAVEATLGRTLTRVPWTTPSEFPSIPKLDAKRLLALSMRAKPDVFVGLDDNTVAVGFYDLSPLEVWDLAAGELVRKSDYLGQYCYSMASLLGQRIAAGWHNGTQNVVAVFDATTGKRVQELVGFGNHIYGMVLVEDRLLTMCLDQTLRVWNQDPEGKFTEEAKFVTTGCPYGKMTVLSPTTVAMSTFSPVQIEVWDWKAGKCVRTLTGFAGGHVWGHSLLPNGRIVAVDYSGTIRVGSLDDWAAHTAVSNGSILIGVAAGEDGSFVTTDYNGDIKLWRNGACEVTLTGGYTSGFYGVPLAVVGRRLVVIGSHGTLLMFE